MSGKTSTFWRALKSLLVTVLVVGVVFGAVAHHQEIVDHLKFWSYQPSPSVANLAKRGGFSEKGRFYFYVAMPELESADDFNADCRRVEQASPILGCYNRLTDRIHIYDIQDPELDGIKEVTAAHEMLHVVFRRASTDEKDQLETWLEKAYQVVKTPKLEERMAYYDRAQPGSRVDELHSILGTEFADLSSDLEKYYSQYFDNRQQVIKLNQGYSKKFNDLESEATRLSADLEQRLKTINTKSAQYEADLRALNAKINNFNTRASRGDFANQETFEAERATLNGEIKSMNLRRAEIRRLIDEYNRDVGRVNQLGEQMNKLNKSLDSLEAVK